MKLEPLDKKEDKRGLLVEAYKFPTDGQVFYVICNPGETRGNHYHLKRTEHFLVIYGSALMMVRDRETGDVMKAEVSGSRPMRITVTPPNTHAIRAGKQGCIFLVWADDIFNPDKPDTIMEEI